MFAGQVSRLAGVVAKHCGASSETESAVRLGVAAVCVPADPIGGTIAVGRVIARDEAKKGRKGAKIVDCCFDAVEVAVSVPTD